MPLIDAHLIDRLIEAFTPDRGNLMTQSEVWNAALVVLAVEVLGGSCATVATSVEVSARFASGAARLNVIVVVAFAAKLGTVVDPTRTLLPTAELLK